MVSMSTVAHSLGSMPLFTCCPPPKHLQFILHPHSDAGSHKQQQAFRHICSARTRVMHGACVRQRAGQGQRAGRGRTLVGWAWCAVASTWAAAIAPPNIVLMSGRPMRYDAPIDDDTNTSNMYCACEMWTQSACNRASGTSTRHARAQERDSALIMSLNGSDCMYRSACFYTGQCFCFYTGQCFWLWVCIILALRHL